VVVLQPSSTGGALWPAVTPGTLVERLAAVRVDRRSNGNKEMALNAAPSAGAGACPPLPLAGPSLCEHHVALFHFLRITAARGLSRVVIDKDDAIRITAAAGVTRPTAPVRSPLRVFADDTLTALILSYV
jgi:hypothetical protein